MSETNQTQVYADGLPFTNEGKLSAQRAPVAYYHQGFAFTASHALAIDSGDDPEYVAPHTHVIDDVIDLRSTLDAKALASHVHSMGDVIGLQSALDGKANSSHTHVIAEVTGLQGALDEKAAASHTHTIDHVIDLQPALDAKQNVLGFTPENSANRGQANGYAPLDTTGRIAAAFLPSFVDDVLEFDNLAAFPAPGESGKIYVALSPTAPDTVAGRIYRWGGSGYTEISGSPGSTDAVPEGAVNLYFTDPRARAAITGAASTIAGSNLTTSRALISSGSGKVAVSTVTSAELDYVSGVTSAIQAQLNGKAAASHSHAILDVVGLQTALDGKANASHTHVIAEVTGLQTALDAKAALSHSHVISEVTGLQTALDGKASASHTHFVDDVIGLQTRLDDKADAVHTHHIAEVINLQSTLDSKASASSLGNYLPLAGGALTGNLILTQNRYLGLEKSGGHRLSLDANATTNPALAVYNQSTQAFAPVFASDYQLTGSRTVWHSGNLVLTSSATDTTAGRVLKVGDGGWHINGTWPSERNITVDCNTATVTGTYVVSSASINRPAGAAAGWILVAGSNVAGTYSSQVYFENETGSHARAWMRRQFNGAWTVWQENWSTGNLTLTASNTDTTVGRAVTTGWGGVLTDAAVTVGSENADANTRTLNAITRAASEANAPSWITTTNVHAYATWPIVSNRGLQWAFSPNDGTRISFRTYTAGNFAAWAEVWHSGNLTLTASNGDTTAGRVLKVGDYGLGAYIAVSDANNIHGVIPGGTPAFIEIGTAATNRPSFMGSRIYRGLACISASKTFGWAMLSDDANPPSVAFRNLASGVWGNWVEAWHTGNLLNIGTTAASARTALALGTAATANVTTGDSDRTAGRAMTVGYNGWGRPITATDLNVTVDQNATSIFSTGFQALNRPPAGNYHSALVFSHNLSGGYETAIVSAAAQDRLWFRNKNAGTWDVYREIYHSASVVPLTNGGTGSTTQSGARLSLGLGSAATLNQTDVVLMTGDQTIAGVKTFTGTINAAHIRADSAIAVQGGNSTASAIILRNHNDTATTSSIRWNGLTAASGGAANNVIATWDGVAARLRFANSSGSASTLECASIIQTSARRFKQNIQTLPANGEAFDALRPVTYEPEGGGPEEIGLVAEELQLLYPQTVGLDPDGQCRGIDYAKIVAVLIAEVKDLRRRVALLEARPSRP